MLNIILSFCVFLTFSFSIIGCKKDIISRENLESEIKRSYPEYDRLSQCIYYKERTEFDVRPVIKTLLVEENDSVNTKMTFGLEFFNYGERIRLCKRCTEDIFIPLGKIHGAYNLSDRNDITIIENEEDMKYGTWGYVNLVLFNQIIEDVFITPLAMKAYNNRKANELILCIIDARNDKHTSEHSLNNRYETHKFLYAIFHADPTTRILIDEQNVPWHDLDRNIHGDYYFTPTMITH